MKYKKILSLTLSLVVYASFSFFHSHIALAECGIGVTTSDGDACNLQYRGIIDSGYRYCDYSYTTCCESVNECPDGSDPPPPFSIGEYSGPTEEFFNALNPLTNPELGGDPEVGGELTTPGGIVTKLLRYALPLAGMILFVMILWGGFEILAGSASKKSMDAGRQRITAAIVGFILLFVSFWIMQILEIIFGVSIV